MLRFLVAGALLPLACSAGCAGGPALRAAERGDQPGLREAIATREASGGISSRQAACIAHAVAAREVRSSPAPESVQRVRDVRSCARELDGALADRMRIHDDAGAEAALARLEDRALPVDAVRAYAADPDAAWRAVGVRSLVEPGDREVRLLALGDPDPRVRREAIRACRDAAVAADWRPLFEVARVDPEPIVRTEAVRALGSLPPVDGDKVALALRDLWTAADSPLRGDLADAWAAPAIWGAGGREALRDVITTEHGPGAIEAAAAVLRRESTSSRPGAGGADLARDAVQVLARAITAGPEEWRAQAIAEAPLDRPEILAAAREAAHGEDPRTRVPALARLAGRSDPAAVAALEALAQPGSRVAVRARLALAFAGDRRVQRWVEEGLVASSPEDRVVAASALGALGVAGRAAPLLADADPAVRTRAACAILAGVRSVH